MDNQDIRALKILEETDNGQLPSQRYLADKLNISLGLVNSFLKRLVSKGYFKITNIPANRVKYILTPKGATEKSRLTYEYIQYSFLFYKDSRSRLHKLFERLSAQKVDRVIFYHVSDLAEIAYLSLQEFEIELSAVIDKSRVGENFFGVKIVDFSDIKFIDFDRVLVTSMNGVNQDIKTIVKSGIDHQAIVTL